MSFIQFSTALFGLGLCFSKPCLADSSLPVLSDKGCPQWLEHRVSQLHSKKEIDLCEVTRGKVLLLVNTASHCGFSGQFKDLEVLHQRYAERGLVVIGFPSNDFKQEAETSAETAKICYHNYGVSFLMADKLSVKGEAAHPVFKHLAEQAGKPGWNFHKYVVDRQGRVLDRYSNWTNPLSGRLTRLIEAQL